MGILYVNYHYLVIDTLYSKEKIIAYLMSTHLYEDQFIDSELELIKLDAEKQLLEVNSDDMFNSIKQVQKVGDGSVAIQSSSNNTITINNGSSGDIYTNKNGKITKITNGDIVTVKNGIVKYVGSKGVMKFPEGTPEADKILIEAGIKTATPQGPSPVYGKQYLPIDPMTGKKRSQREFDKAWAKRSAELDEEDAYWEGRFQRKKRQSRKIEIIAAITGVLAALFEALQYFNIHF